MTDANEPVGDSASHTDGAGMEPLDPSVQVLLDRRFLGVTVAVVGASLLLMSITLRIPDMSYWVFLGYMVPLIFWPPYLVGMTEEERRRAIQEGRHNCVTRNPGHGFRLKHARLQRISPFRGRLFLTNMLAGVCMSLALVTVATIELAKYLAG